MTDEFIAGGKLIFRNLSNQIGRGTVVDHFHFCPDAGVRRTHMIAGNRRNSFSALFTAAGNQALSIRTDPDVITSPQFIFSLAVTTFAGWLQHQFSELLFQLGQVDSILRPLWTSNTRSDRSDIEIKLY